MLNDYLDNCEHNCKVVVETMDHKSASAWSPFFSTEIIDLSSTTIEDYILKNENIFWNQYTDLLVVHLPDFAALPTLDAKLNSVMSVISRHTKNYVAILSADDFYLPTQSSELWRESPDKFEWVERNRRDVNDTDIHVPTPSPSPSPIPYSGEYLYTTRWPEYVWECLLSFLLLIIIFSYGVCCLCGLDTPRRFDNPKEKNL